MTAVLERPLAPCAQAGNGTGCARSTLTTGTTTTAPRATEGCALTGKDCPSDQATIDTCPEC